MNSQGPLLLGIDVGTGGVRVLAVSDDGHVAAAESVAFDKDVADRREGRHEQPPEAWWQAVCRAMRAVVEDLRSQAIPAERLAAVSADGTSGTLVVLDRAGDPLRPAIMYNDPRASAEAEELNAAAGEFRRKLGYQFQSSFALAKLAWLRRHEGEVFGRAAHFVHQADYVLGRLAGQGGVSDYSNALKTGYDLIDDCWPAWIGDMLPVGDRLPRVVAPGTPIGAVSAAAAEATGLPAGLPVVAGATDGTAAFLASGACCPGDYNTTVGTTLVFKGISRTICRHPQGLVYCHKLPGGYWLPGAAGNAGAAWIPAWFPEADLYALDAAAARLLPTYRVAYPLVHRGERFPFLCDAAEAFRAPTPSDPVERYAACLQGTALVERLCYQVLDDVGGAGEVVTGSGGKSPVYSTGGGSRSDVWMQCRADATGRTLHRPACGESAFGAAVLAAVGQVPPLSLRERARVRASSVSPSLANSPHPGPLPRGEGDNPLAATIRRMVRIERNFAPNPERTTEYDRLFARFCDELRKRGYL